MANFDKKIEIAELNKGVHCVYLGESFQTLIYLHNLASIQPRTSPLKFARSPRRLPRLTPLSLIGMPTGRAKPLTHALQASLHLGGSERYQLMGNLAFPPMGWSTLLST